MTTCYLRQRYESQRTTPRSRGEALERYAGYDDEHAARRLKLGAGWEACERALPVINGDAHRQPEAVMNALAPARGVEKSDAGLRQALFAS